MNLTNEQMERYSRQIILPYIGGKGQEKILSAKVIIVGIGGLGSLVAAYIAGAGVGTLGIVDSDTVNSSNLHRQIIYSNNDIGKEKVIVAQDRLQNINPDIKVIPYALRLTSENIMSIIEDYDVIVDGSDNFPTRYLLNDACFLSKKPLVYGAFFRFEGQATVIKPDEGPCYRCLFPNPPSPGTSPSCQEAGVFGTLAGVIGLIQATETLKLILGIRESLVGELLIFDALEMDFWKVRVSKDKNCTLCGESHTHDLTLPSAT